MMEYLIAAFLGFVEGLTEFLPVSSTGHLILLIDGFGLPMPPGRVFEVFIQMGAILAVMVLYRKRIFDTIRYLPTEKKAQRFTMNLIVATLPAMICGATLYGFIKGTLYHPLVIACSLIVGGIIILIVERRGAGRAEHVRYETVDDLPLKTAFLVGCCQMIALIPGVSRSGATIIGGLSLGLSRPAAAEFSFFLAMPVMSAAVAYDVYRNWDALMEYDAWPVLITGFLFAFLTALSVVKLVIRFISQYGFAPFGWYRIALGLIALVIFL